MPQRVSPAGAAPSSIFPPLEYTPTPARAHLHQFLFSISGIAPIQSRTRAAASQTASRAAHRSLGDLACAVALELGLDLPGAPSFPLLSCRKGGGVDVAKLARSRRAPRQFLDKLPVRRQKVQIAQSLRSTPFRTLEHDIANRRRLDDNRKEYQLNRLTHVRITMARAKNFRSHHRLHSQLLPQLARQPRLRRLAHLQFPARKFPHELKPIPTPPLTHQNLPLRLNQPSHHSQHAVSRIARANSRAPSTNGGPGVFKSSSRITTTRPFRTAGTSRHAGFRSAEETFARPPVAAQANTINSGAARATSSSVTCEPAPTTIFPPAISTNSATQGGELIRGFGQASQ